MLNNSFFGNMYGYGIIIPIPYFLKWVEHKDSDWGADLFLPF